MISTPLNVTLLEQSALFNEHKERALALTNEVIKNLSSSESGKKLLEGAYDYVIGHPEDLTDARFLSFLLENKLAEKVMNGTFNEITLQSSISSYVLDWIEFRLN